MKSNQIKETLICELTDQERREYGIQLATMLGDMEAIEAEKKRNADHFKDRLAGLQASCDTLSRKVRDGKEWRDVECEVLLGMPDKTHKQIVRLDTGETVRTLLMDQRDLQLMMPLDPEADGEDEEEGCLIREDGSDDEFIVAHAEVMEEVLAEEAVGEVVYQAGDEEPEEGPEIVDAEPDAPRDLRDEEVAALLIDLEAVPKNQRKKRLADLHQLWGDENIRKLDRYRQWVDADEHLKKTIQSRINDLAEAQPEGAEADY